MTFDIFKDILLSEFPDTTPEQLKRFEALDALYRDWNAKINVISRKDIDGIYHHHVLHSLGIAAYWKRNACIEAAKERGLGADGLKVLDLGTGGGFPGIPLAIMFPDLKFTLCDSIGKKVLVAREVASALGLKNVTAVNARAESLPETFDFVVSRAVTTLENFYPWVKGKYNGSIFYLKGGDVNEEIYNMMSKFKLAKGSVRTWKIDSWLEDEYFAEKFVIQIGNDYICSPIVENI